jgi:hypothetical protein
MCADANAVMDVIAVDGKTELRAMRVDVDVDDLEVSGVDEREVK